MTTKLETGLFVDGAYRAAETGETIDVLNPATNEPLAAIARASTADLEAAVAAARRAFDGGWGTMNPFERSTLLHKLGDAVGAHAEELAGIESDDVGKPLVESVNIDVASAAATFHYFADLAVDLFGQQLPGPYNEVLNYTVREPLGVVGAIIPWNFPFLIAARKIGSALAAGNTMVIKPSVLAPLSTLQLGRLANEAGLPPGTLNIVVAAGADVGRVFTSAVDMDEITFTGSTEVGRALMQKCAPGLKGCTLELGGKSPGLVLPDCDLAETIAGTLFGVFLNQGECCCGLTRLIVHADVYEAFVDGFVDGAEAIQVGLPRDTDTKMGPVISVEHLERVLGYVDAGRGEGANVLCGGTRLTNGALARGNFMGPTVLGNVSPAMKVWKEEIFGPVATVTRANSVDEMVELANDTAYGLAASIWTTNLKHGHRLASRIHAGTVWCNLHNFVFPSVPYGGFKDSGIGSELGRQGVLALTRTKSVMISLFEDGFAWY